MPQRAGQVKDFTTKSLALLVWRFEKMKMEKGK